MSAAAGHDLASPTKTRILIDTDVGLDDAQAIMMALASDDVIIEGITAVAGNTTVDHVCRNIRKVLHLCDRVDIPVYKGSAEPLIRPSHWVSDHRASASPSPSPGARNPEVIFNGMDGLGDVKDHDAKSDNVIEYGHAANFLTEAVNRYPKQIVLICIGPLTNVALAMKLDSKMGENLKGCYIMGGNYRGQGNATPCSEFNFHYDPEAASIVLANLKCPTTIVCHEVCIDHVINWDQWERIYAGNGPVRHFIRKRESKMVEWRKKRGLPYILADQFAMGILLDRRLAAELFQAAAEVELRGGITRGMMAVIRHMREGDHPLSIVMKMKMDKFLETLTQALDKLDQRVAAKQAAQAQLNHNHAQQRKFSKTISQYLPSPPSSSS